MKSQQRGKTVIDEPPDLRANDAPFAVVEIAIDVPERRQIEEHGVHLLLGLRRVVAETHGPKRRANVLPA